MDYRFFYDRYIETQFGANQILVLDPGTVHIIEDMRNVGSFAGDRGTSFYTTFADPRSQCWSPAGMSMIQWDLHHKMINCDETLSDGYSGGTQTFSRGNALYISKHYGLFTIPNDAYDGADLNVGSNGTIRYTINNA